MNPTEPPLRTQMRARRSLPPKRGPEGAWTPPPPPNRMGLTAGFAIMAWAGLRLVGVLSAGGRALAARGARASRRNARTAARDVCGNGLGGLDRRGRSVGAACVGGWGGWGGLGCGGAGMRCVCIVRVRVVRVSCACACACLRVRVRVRVCVCMCACVCLLCSGWMAHQWAAGDLPPKPPWPTASHCIDCDPHAPRRPPARPPTPPTPRCCHIGTSRRRAGGR